MATCVLGGRYACCGDVLFRWPVRLLWRRAFQVAGTPAVATQHQPSFASLPAGERPISSQPATLLAPQADPYCRLWLRDGAKVSTSVRGRTVNPRWDEHFTLIVHSAAHQVLSLVIYDSGEAWAVCMLHGLV